MKPAFSLIVTLLFITATGSAQTSKQVADSFINKLGQQFLKDSTAVGLSIGVYDNGQIKYYNFGSIDKDKKILPSQTSVYEVGSITKTFSAYLLAKAVVEKKVDLNDDIRKWLKGTYPNLEYEGHPIRLLHLANLSSGLPDWIPAQTDAIKNAKPDSVSFIQSKFYGSYTKKDFLNALHEVVIDTIPGFKKRHSNGAAQLLYYILEDVYGASFEQLVKRYITAPNGMNQTYFLKPGQQGKNLVKPYNDHGIFVPRFNMPVLQGAGGLNSSAEDMVKYIRLQLDTARKEIQLLHTKTLDAGGYDVGLTWYKYRYDNGLSQIWFQGGTSGCLSYVFIYPELNSGVVLLANASSNYIYSKLSGMAYSIFQKMQGK